MSQTRTLYRLLKAAGPRGIHSPGGITDEQLRRLYDAGLIRDPDPPPGFCACGCGEATKRVQRNFHTRGIRKGDPRRFVAGHARRKLGGLFRVEDCGHETPCWVWRGCLNKGYGQIGVDGKTRLAHRHFFSIANGQPIPESLVMDHLCDNPPCVNPAHLRAVTNAQNVRRGKSSLTEEDVRALRASPLGCRRAAREFGISKPSVLAIRARRRWAEVE